MEVEGGRTHAKEDIGEGCLAVGELFVLFQNMYVNLTWQE
jgi:hypothetical protein